VIDDFERGPRVLHVVLDALRDLRARRRARQFDPAAPFVSHVERRIAEVRLRGREQIAHDIDVAERRVVDARDDLRDLFAFRAVLHIAGDERAVVARRDVEFGIDAQCLLQAVHARERRFVLPRQAARPRDEPIAQRAERDADPQRGQHEHEAPAADAPSRIREPAEPRGVAAHRRLFAFGGQRDRRKRIARDAETYRADRHDVGGRHRTAARAERIVVEEHGRLALAEVLHRHRECADLKAQLLRRDLAIGQDHFAIGRRADPVRAARERHRASVHGAAQEAQIPRRRRRILRRRSGRAQRGGVRIKGDRRHDPAFLAFPAALSAAPSVATPRRSAMAARAAAAAVRSACPATASA